MQFTGSRSRCWQAAVAAFVALAVAPCAARAQGTLAMDAYQVGRAQRIQGDPAAALAAFTEALALDPRYAPAWAARGELLLESGQYAAAASDLTEALRLQPSSAATWAARGLAQYLDGDSAAARDDLAAAVQLDPHSGRAEQLRGYLLYDRNQIEAAYAAWERAERLDPALRQSVHQPTTRATLRAATVPSLASRGTSIASTRVASETTSTVPPQVASRVQFAEAPVPGPTILRATQNTPPPPPTLDDLPPPEAKPTTPGWRKKESPGNAGPAPGTTPAAPAPTGPAPPARLAPPLPPGPPPRAVEPAPAPLPSPRPLPEGPALEVRPPSRPVPTLDDLLVDKPPLGSDPCPRPDELKRIDEVRATLSDDGGERPRECPIHGETFAGRNWTLHMQSWKASALCHKPLYFEQPALERYGHSTGRLLQPVVSGAHFFAAVPLLPYQTGLAPPWECQYPLGHYRPGSCAPYIVPPLPVSLRGAVQQAGAIVGASAVLP